jgi:hypothetical protein
MALVAHCLSCGGSKDQGKYLCSTCWFRVPPAERRKLGRRDGKAGVRLLELAKQLGADTPPEEVRISS